ncbi:GEVED domain-containing protein [Dyadobacter fermentans]|nr:GEVED domain-containing protein [Dyadobacter fermentans]
MEIGKKTSIISPCRAFKPIAVPKGSAGQHKSAGGPFSHSSGMFRRLALYLFLIFTASGRIYAQNYCASASTSDSNQDIVNVTIGALNNSSGCNQTAGTGSIPGRYSNYTDLTPISLPQLNNIPFSVDIALCGPSYGSSYVTIWIDLNHNGSFEEADERVFQSGRLFASHFTISDSLKIPETALLGLTRMRIITSKNADIIPCDDYQGSETEDYTINIVEPLLCTGVPELGNTTTAQTTVCLNSVIDFSLSSRSLLDIDEIGISYQWYNNAGPITGATGRTYTATITQADNFYCQVTCNQTGQTGQSTPVSISLKTYTECYCLSAAIDNTGMEILNVTAGSLNHSTDFDETGGPGSILGSYSDFTTLVAAPDFNQLATIPFSVDISSDYYTQTSAWIDYNKNGIFEYPEERVYQSTGSRFGSHVLNGSFKIPSTSLTGITRMRVITRYGQEEMISACGEYEEGETEDYLVNILSPPVCSGSPIQATTVATQNEVCPDVSFTFSLTPSITTTGNTYQWYNSDGPIIGATNETYTASITKADTYYCDVTCPNSAQTTASVPAVVNAPYLYCACTSASTESIGESVSNVTVGTLNNSSGCGQTGGPGSVLKKYSDYTTLLAPPDLALTVPIPYSVTNTACGAFGSTSTSIWIDFNHNGVFDAPGERVFNSNSYTWQESYTLSGSFVIPADALPGLARMRIITAAQGGLPMSAACGTYASGETEDYFVNLLPIPACSGSPVQTETIATQNPSCPDVNFTFSLTPAIYTPGITYQWYNNAGPIEGATDKTYTTAITTEDSFYCEITCLNSNETTSSTPAKVDAAYLYCPCVSGATSSDYQDIVNVTIGALDNSSNCGETGGPGSLASRYSDYTMLEAPDLVKQENIPIAIEISDCNGYRASTVSIWIDYNHNGSFDSPGEHVYNSGPIDWRVPYNLTGSMVIPENALTGKTRMRVIIVSGGADPTLSACGEYVYGETEDYYINIVAPGCDGPVSLPATATSHTQNVATTPLVSIDCQYFAKVVPGEGFTDVTVKSWLETTPPFRYVPRHYEITPATNPNTATGIVTLYFTQADFDAYNGTIPLGFLPTGPDDVSGIANFQIVKFAGTSPTGLGYAGPPSFIPGDNHSWNTGDYTLIWNPTHSIWEVTFPVAGFSGFLAKSVEQSLPVTLVTFTGKPQETNNELIWKTSSEVNFSHFEIERSVNARSFENIGKKVASESGRYTFLDSDPPQATVFYRLKMMDLDTRYSYSKIIAIENNALKPIVGNFYPNPSSGEVYIDINSIKKTSWKMTTYDLTGRLRAQKTVSLKPGLNVITIDKLSPGLNILKFENGSTSEIRKVVKQ